MTDSFFTIESESRSLFKDRNSKFIGLIFPVDNEETIKNIQQNLRKEFFDARHQCFAYIIGFEKEKFRTNDDGEPSGTAGKPIYNQLLSSNLTNVLAVVVRYFGGTKLGVPGLINAYKTATKDAIANSKIIEKFTAKKFTLSFPYETMNTAMQISSNNSVKIISTDFDMNCKIEIAVKINYILTLYKKVENTKISITEIDGMCIF